ncbi:SWIM zinc finger family protein [Nocardiopsis terrae]
MPSYTREDLIQLAGAKSYHRGVGYVSRVRGVTVAGNTVRGIVSGTDLYRVELTPRRRGLEWDCDCPWAEDGNFCKHCVALGLVHLDMTAQGAVLPQAPDVRAYLGSLDGTALVDLVLETAEALPELRQRLELRATLAGGGTADGAGRAMVDGALRLGDFVGYEEARGYAERVHGVAGELERLLETGAAGEAERLARHAVGVLDEHAGMVDDSAGYLGGAGARLVEAHVAACTVAGPDPLVLAGWLLDLQLDGSGCPELLLEAYADVLGEEGLERYRRDLFEGELGEAARGWAVGFLRSEYARVAGDTDLLVRVYASGEHVHYTGIVAALEEDGRSGEALEWAERGLRESGAHPDGRLLDHVVRAYRDAGRGEELRALRWEVFERSPTPHTYRALREDSPRDEWPAVRGQALALLRLAAARRRAAHFPCTLVEVLLDEGDAEAVWEAAVEHGCDDGQWLRVAELREESHPEDAIGVYLPRIEAKVGLTDTRLYPEAARLARRVHELYGRLGRADEARAFVAGLRAGHRRKRRFLAELDRVGLRA